MSEKINSDSCPNDMPNPDVGKLLRSGVGLPRPVARTFYPWRTEAIQSRDLVSEPVGRQVERLSALALEIPGWLVDLEVLIAAQPDGSGKRCEPDRTRRGARDVEEWVACSVCR